MGQLRSQLSPRLLLLALLVAGFALAWRQLNQIPLLVVGQPSVTGPLQRDKEAPFFAGLRERTGLPIKVTYKPVDQIGFKDVYQLQSLKDGTFDLVSLRFIQNSRVEPSLAGIDLPGLIADYPTAKRVAAAYAGTVDRYLQQRYGSKLLGIWSFGPQEVFCRRPVGRLADLRGMSIRVASPLLATVLEELGAQPAVIPFEDTRAALEAGLVDCAITSAQSAHFAGWLAYATHSYPIAFQFGLNGYAMSLAKWNAFSPQQQRLLVRTFEEHVSDFWATSRRLQAEVSRCHAGGPCGPWKPYRLQRVEPSPADIARLREIMDRKLWPAWAVACDRVHPGCRKEWQEKLGAFAAVGPLPR
ncbi:MAG: TRAP transporter substrate-binding protein DctP [Cyanobium sp. ELA507]